MLLYMLFFTEGMADVLAEAWLGVSDATTRASGNECCPLAQYLP